MVSGDDPSKEQKRVLSGPVVTKDAHSTVMKLPLVE